MYCLEPKETTMSTNLALAIDNSPAVEARNAFETEVERLGALSGEGKDALPMLFLAVVRAVGDGIVKIDKKNDRDDTPAIFERYSGMEGKKMQHERSKGSAKAQVSKLRSAILAAQNPNVTDATVFFERVAEIHQADKRSDAPSMVPAFDAFVKVARVIKKENRELTDAEITEAMVRKVADKSLEKDLKAIAAKLDKIVNGTEDTPAVDDSEELATALDLVNRRIQLLQYAAEQEEFVSEAAKRGFQVVKFGEPAPYAG
jgi:hypothetical protein